MKNNTKLVYNGLTGEILVEELSNTENAELLAEWENARLAKEAKAAEVEAKAEAKAAAQAKLAALGLTVEDLQALGL